MSTLTIPIDDKLYDRVQSFSWVRWSKVVQDGIRKRKIREVYLREKSISEADVAFCEEVDWHPVDELPIRQEVIDKLKKSNKRSLAAVRNVSEAFR